MGFCPRQQNEMLRNLWPEAARRYRMVMAIRLVQQPWQIWSRSCSSGIQKKRGDKSSRMLRQEAARRYAAVITMRFMQQPQQLLWRRALLGCTTHVQDACDSPKSAVDKKSSKVWFQILSTKNPLGRGHSCSTPQGPSLLDPFPLPLPWPRSLPSFELCDGVLRAHGQAGSCFDLCAVKIRSP